MPDDPLSPTALLTYGVTAFAVLGVVARPFRWPEAVWAVIGALALVLAQALPVSAAWTGIAKGLDVYLFLIGMMALAEVARREGLFDWLAIEALSHAKGSPRRLFALVYVAGTAVTTVLSNDATAVVLTPAVYAVAKAARAKPLPYLFICAFIANAASFVLPISNPANLVVFAGHMPPLGLWLARFGLASIASIVLTYLVLRWSQASALRDTIASGPERAPLSRNGKIAAAGIGLAGLALIVASALDWQLGAPAFVVGLLTMGSVLVVSREHPGAMLKGISWSVLPLVGGLFVLVEALERTGLLATLDRLLAEMAHHSVELAAWTAGVGIAVVCNVANNLPVGLLAGAAVTSAKLPDKIIDAVLIGVDLGPNLSITGSLATILWLTAIRREGENVGFWHFLKLGALVMPPALIAALGARLLMP